nr:MAG TPA: hypothetical protein [Caudoviricetes sp.]
MPTALSQTLGLVVVVAGAYPGKVPYALLPQHVTIQPGRWSWLAPHL